MSGLKGELARRSSEHERVVSGLVDVIDKLRTRKEGQAAVEVGDSCCVVPRGFSAGQRPRAWFVFV